MAAARQRQRMVRAWSLLALLLLGCAPLTPPPRPRMIHAPAAGSIIACPHDGGLPWTELTSPHFVVRTTKSSYEARLDIQAMEDLLLAIQGAVEYVLPVAPSPSRTAVLLLTDDMQFHSIVPPNADGIAAPRDDHGRPLIVIESGNSPLVFRHELTHRLVFQRLPRAPAWLNEGLAEYFSMIRLEKGIAHLGIATPRVHRLTSSRFEKSQQPGMHLLLVDEDMPTLAMLMDADEATLESDEKYYIAAWAAVHFFANGGRDHASRFRTFLKAVAAGTQPSQALAAGYGQWSVIEDRYREYLHVLSAFRPTVNEWTFPLVTARTIVVPEVRPLADAEVHRLWSFFLPHRAQEQLQLAEQHDPQSPSTHLLEAFRAFRQKLYTETLEAFDLAAATPPVEPFVSALRLSIRLELETNKPVADRSLEPLATDAHELAKIADETATLAVVARYGALSGDVALGLPAAERAVALDPYCFECLTSLAQLYFAKGDFAAAVDNAELAVHRWPKRGGAPWSSLEQLRCYRRRAAGEQVSCTL
jgi:hypothetical protein